MELNLNKDRSGKFYVRIEDFPKEDKSSVIITCANFLKEEAVDLFSSLFETEMLAADIKTGTEETVISFDTSNKESVEVLRKTIYEDFRQAAALNNINYN